MRVPEPLLLNEAWPADRVGGIVLLLLGLMLVLVQVLPAVTTPQDASPAAASQAASAAAAGLPTILASRQLLAARHLSVGDVVELSSDASGANPRRFRIAGTYEPMPDPIRLTSERLEVRFHLPDLLDLTANPDDPLSAEAVSAINVGLTSPTDAAGFARDMTARVPTIGARASRNATGDGNPFVVLGRFHQAIAILTVTTSAVFLLAVPSRHLPWGW